MFTLLLSAYLILVALLPLVMRLFGYKPDKSRMYCGITAYVGNKPADPGIIKFLILFNQDRGDDSTGWAVNNKIKKSIDKALKFLAENKLETLPEHENYTIIAHDRKRSVGGNTERLAHPFGMYKNDTEKEEYDLILAMNGTVTNTDEISAEFGVKHEKHMSSDTELVAKIMTKLGKDYIKVLEGYEGSATLVFFTPSHPNTLLVYRDPARTLFYWKMNEDQVYISSTKESLVAVGANAAEVVEFPDNEVTLFKEGKITRKIKITRNPIRPKYVAPIKNVREIANGYNERWNRSSVAHYPNQGSRSEYYDSWKEADLKIDSASALTIAEISKLQTNKDYHSKYRGNVYMILDKYWRNGHPIQQQLYYLNDKGEVGSATDVMSGYRPYYFVNGFMCKDEKAYNELVKKCSDAKGAFQINSFKRISISEICDLLKYPCVTTVQEKQAFILNDEYSNKIGDLKSKKSITVDMFLSEFIYEITWGGRFTVLHKRRCCFDAKVTRRGEKSDTNSKAVGRDIVRILDLEKEFSKTNSSSYLESVLQTGIKDTPEFYYTKMRAYWRVNPHQVIRNYFFYLLLDLFLKDGILSKENHPTFVKEGEEGMHASIEYLNEVKKCIRLYQQKKFSNAGREELDGSIKATNKLEGLNTSDKMNKFENGECNMEELIQSLKECNDYWNNKDFQNDMYTAESDFDTFMNTYVPKTSLFLKKESDLFCEAVLISLAEVGQFTKQDLIVTIGYSSMVLNRMAREHYEEWRINVEDISKKTVTKKNAVSIVDPDKEESISIQDIEPEDVNEAEDVDETSESVDDEVVMIENWDLEDMEKDYEEQFVERIKSLEDFIQTCAERTTEEMNSSVIGSLCDAMKEAVKDLKSNYKRITNDTGQQ